MINIFKRLFPSLERKIVVGFDSSGCMGQIYKFEFMGYVTREWKSEAGVDVYSVKPIFHRNLDSRSEDFKEIVVWQIQHIKDNIYAFYY